MSTHHGIQITKNPAHPGAPTPFTDPEPPAPLRSDWPLYLIAADKLFKGLLVLGIGIEALRLMHRNLHNTVLAWAHHLHIAPGNRFLQQLLAHTLGLSAEQRRLLGFGLFFYAALYLVEGVGLLFRLHWAEWVVVISTACFIPIEVYELLHVFTLPKLFVLSVNTIILLYLVTRLGREHGIRCRSATLRGRDIDGPPLPTD